MQCIQDACFIPESQWNSITSWISKKSLEKKEQEKHNEYLRYMRDLSTKLVAGPDSLKQAAAKRYEEHQNEKKKEKIISEDYFRILKNQNDKRKEIIKKHQRMAMLNRTPTLELTSSLRHGAVLYERQKQVQLNEMKLKRIKELEKREYEEFKKQLDASDCFHKRKIERSRNEQKLLEEFLKNQAKQNEDKKVMEYVTRIQEEREDLLRMGHEWQHIQELDRRKKIEKKNESLNLLKKAAEEARQKRHFEKKEEQELYNVHQVFNNAKNNIQCRIKQQIKKDTEDRINRNFKITESYLSRLPPINPSEEVLHQNGVLRTEEEYSKKLAEKIALRKKQAEDRIQNYKDDLERKKLKDEEDNELKRIEMLERFKKDEAMKKLDEMYKMEERERKKKYADELLEQAAETRTMRQNEKKAEEAYIFTSFKNQDDNFADYANEVLEFAEKNNFSTIPIRKTIEDYKKTQAISVRKRKEVPIKKSAMELHFEQQYKNLSPRTEEKFTKLG